MQLVPLFSRTCALLDVQQNVIPNGNLQDKPLMLQKEYRSSRSCLGPMVMCVCVYMWSCGGWLCHSDCLPGCCLVSARWVAMPSERKVQTMSITCFTLSRHWENKHHIVRGTKMCNAYAVDLIAIHRNIVCYLFASIKSSCAPGTVAGKVHKLDYTTAYSL